MKKKKYLLFAFLVMIISCAGTVFAYRCFTATISVTNQIASGDINIELKEYSLEDGKRQTYSDPETILPGDKISKIPVISNLARPCWIRVHTEYENPEEVPEKLSDQNLFGIGEQWQKIGDYYYYKKILEAQESVDFFQGLNIPPDWDNVYETKSFAVTVRAEAIQAENYQPNFNSDSPWGNQEIQECVHGADYTNSETIDAIVTEVEFNGNAQSMMLVPDNFFEGFSDLMPGDTKTGTIQISNNSEESTEFFFRTSLPAQNKRQVRFLEKIQLKITYKNKLLYSGNLIAENRKEDISLGTYPANETGQMEFELYFPKEIQNEFARQNGCVKWIFSANAGITASPSPTQETNSRPEGNEHLSDFSNESSLNVSAVSTGDHSQIETWFKLICSSVLLIILLMIAKKKGRKSS